MESSPNIGNMKENLKQGVKQELDKRGWTDAYQNIQEKARQAVDASEEYVKVHPFYTLLGAATIGFLAGMLINRNK